MKELKGKCKVILVWVCVFIITNNMSIVQGAIGGFLDIDTLDWFYDHVQTLVEKDVIDGYPDGTFKPDNTMQIDQFIKTMVVALGYKLDNGKNYWAQPYIDKAMALGIIQNGEFSTYNKEITRAEMARMCERVVVKLEGTRTYSCSNLIRVRTRDREDIVATGLKDYVYHMYEVGIITGYPDGMFRPNNSLKRSEACTVILRVIDGERRKPFTGIEIFENDGNPEMVDFDIQISPLVPFEPQFKEAEKYLNKKIGEELTVEVMAYVRTKTKMEDELPSKFFKWGNKKVQVISSKGLPITIRVW